MAFRNSRRSLLIPALLVACAVLTDSPAGAIGSTPAITFESETCELGSVAQGEKPDCVFSFTNSGSADLRILQVEPTCGCTTAMLSATLVPAGARGGIHVVFDSENFSGEIVKEVEVRSDDPVRRSVTLRVKALVELEIDFEPGVVAFDDVRPGALLKSVVMLTNRRAEPVRVLRLEAAPSSYRCQMPAWPDRSQPLVLESWDRVAIEVAFAAPRTLAMAIPGECALEIEGPRKRHFRLKLLALPAP